MSSSTPIVTQEYSIEFLKLLNQLSKPCDDWDDDSSQQDKEDFQHDVIAHEENYLNNFGDQQ